MNVVLDTCELTEFALYYYAVSMSVFNNFLCEFYILVKRIFGTVYHDRRKSAVYAGFAYFKICAVVKVKSKVYARVFDSSFCKSHKICVFSIFSCTCRYLKDNGRMIFRARFRDSLDYFHVVYVESAYGISAFVSLFKHFFCCNYCHFYSSFPHNIKKMYAK